VAAATAALATFEALHYAVARKRIRHT
jgi:hypothetical protein